MSENDLISLLSCLVPVPLSVCIWFGASCVCDNMVSWTILLMFTVTDYHRKNLSNPTGIPLHLYKLHVWLATVCFALSLSVLSHIAWSSLSLHFTTSTKCQPLFTRLHLLQLLPNPPARAKGRTEVLNSSRYYHSHPFSFQIAVCWSDKIWCLPTEDLFLSIPFTLEDN